MDEALECMKEIYNEKLMKLLVTLPRKYIFYSDRVEETYFFDGKWISRDELCELIFRPLAVSSMIFNKEMIK